MEIIELTTISDMSKQLSVIQHLYPKMTVEKYEEYLQFMLPHNYTQIAVFENNICTGLTGCWYNIKLWSGKYLEIDNFIVHPDYRQKGVGKLMTDYIETKAINLDCSIIVLDAYTSNFKAHRFYYNQGFGAKGFHFVKILDENKLS